MWCQFKSCGLHCRGSCRYFRVSPIMVYTPEGRSSEELNCLNLTDFNTAAPKFLFKQTLSWSATQTKFRCKIISQSRFTLERFYRFLELFNEFYGIWVCKPETKLQVSFIFFMFLLQSFPPPPIALRGAKQKRKRKDFHIQTYKNILGQIFTAIA